MFHHRLIPLMALTLLGLHGCSGSDACTVDADCFRGEVCSAEGTCIVEGDADAATDPGDDSGGSGEDAGGDEDGGAGGDDAGGDDPTDMNDGACVVDPFTYECTDDPGEEDDVWNDGTRLTQDVLGCNPDFVAFDETFPGIMCPNDGSDWFFVNFHSCQGMDYVLEYQVEVLDQCADPDAILVEPLSFECSEDFVECTVEEGKPTIRMIVDDTLRNLQSAYVQIHTDGRNDLTFDYRIRVTVRE
jgi:hypothetical protein